MKSNSLKTHIFIEFDHKVDLDIDILGKLWEGLVESFWIIAGINTTIGSRDSRRWPHQTVVGMEIAKVVSS